MVQRHRRDRVAAREAQVRHSVLGVADLGTVCICTVRAFCAPPVYLTRSMTCLICAPLEPLHPGTARILAPRRRGWRHERMWFHEFDAFLRRHSGGSVALASYVAPIAPHRGVDSASVREQLEGARGYDSFNLFGFDFMLDDAYKHRCEINSALPWPRSREELAGVAGSRHY